MICRTPIFAKFAKRIVKKSLKLTISSAFQKKFKIFNFRLSQRHIGEILKCTYIYLSSEPPQRSSGGSKSFFITDSESEVHFSVMRTIFAIIAISRFFRDNFRYFAIIAFLSKQNKVERFWLLVMKEDIVTMILRKENIKKIEN